MPLQKSNLHRLTYKTSLYSVKPVKTRPASPIAKRLSFLNPGKGRSGRRWSGIGSIISPVTHGQKGELYD